MSNYNFLSDDEIFTSLKKYIEPGSRIVLPLSGGLDSMILAHLLADVMECEIYPIHFDFGSGRNRTAQFDALIHICEWFKEKYGNMFHDLPLSENGEYIPITDGWRLFGHLAEKWYDYRDLKRLRNAFIEYEAALFDIIISIEASSYGSMNDIKASTVVLGSINQDTMGDSSSEFWHHMESAMNIALKKVRKNNPLGVLAPFQILNWGKLEIVEYAKRHDIPIEFAWTCNKGSVNQCYDRPGGKICGKCKILKDAIDTIDSISTETGKIVVNT